MDADVLIVGAGPAGCHLARLLAGQGWRCLLIERHRLPRDKVCGGGVSLKAARLLGGIPSALVRHTIHGALLTHGNQAVVDLDLQRPVGYTVLRREFDRWLWERAGSAGATLADGVAYEGHRVGPGGVTVRTSAGPFRCRLLVGADGAGSRVRRYLTGRSRRLSRAALECLVPWDGGGLPAGRAVFDLGAVPGGYGWIFPKGDHLNLGVFSGLGPNVGPAALRRFLSRYGLSEASGRRLGYPIPLDGPGGPVEGPGVWLLGDAAGLAEPMLGEGIHHALLSARVAARCLQDGIPPAGTYRRALGRVLAGEWRAAHRLGRLVFPRARWVVGHLARRRRFGRRFATLMTGETGYRACLRRTLAALPLDCLAQAELPLSAPLELG